MNYFCAISDEKGCTVRKRRKNVQMWITDVFVLFFIPKVNENCGEKQLRFRRSVHGMNQAKVPEGTAFSAEITRVRRARVSCSFLRMKIDATTVQFH